MPRVSRTFKPEPPSRPEGRARGGDVIDLLGPKAAKKPTAEEEELMTRYSISLVVNEPVERRRVESLERQYGIDRKTAYDILERAELRIKSDNDAARPHHLNTIFNRVMLLAKRAEDEGDIVAASKAYADAAKIRDILDKDGKNLDLGNPAAMSTEELIDSLERGIRELSES